MTSHEISEVRITVWPGRKLPVPDIYVYPVCLIDGKNFGEFLSYATGTPGQNVSLPEEFYIRELFDLDLTSSQSILEFSKTFGRLGSPGWKDLLVTDYGLDMSAYPKLRDIDRLQERFLSKGGFQHPLDRYEISSIEDFMQHAAILRDIVRIWLMLSGQTDLQTIVDSWENQVRQPPSSENNAALYLEGFINAGLQPFHANLKISFPTDDAPGSTSIAPYSPPVLSAYSAACLQLANDISENTRYRVCANESCNRLFSKQRGRSEYGHFRTKSIKYCSATCARAQAQRQLRRRQTKVRTLRRQGETLRAISATTGADIETVKRWTAGIKAVRSKSKPKKKRVNHG
ncbi:MAG: hypothetical protein ACYC0L_01220 [Thermoleophilia bacterium]